MQQPAQARIEVYLNRVAFFGFDPNEKLKAIPGDRLSELKAAYLENGGKRDNAAHGWVRANA